MDHKGGRVNPTPHIAPSSFALSLREIASWHDSPGLAAREDEWGR